MKTDNIDDAQINSEFIRGIISAQRLCACQQYKSDSDKRMSVGVELLLCYHFINTCTDADKVKFPLPIAISDYNKPYFPGNNIEFSFSHSNDYCVCGVSDSLIGVDIEKRIRLIKQNLYNYMHNQDDIDDSLIAWCGKEAYLKYSGYGIGGKYKMCDIAVKNNCIVNTQINETVPLKVIETDDMLITVCTKNCDELEIENVDYQTIKNAYCKHNK